MRAPLGTTALRAPALRLPLSLGRALPEMLGTFYIAIHKTFGTVAPGFRPALERNILALLDELNVGGPKGQ